MLSQGRLRINLPSHHISPSSSTFVGDRLDTDVLFGKKCGMKTILVLTGVHQREHLEKFGEECKPDIVLESIGDLIGGKIN